MFEYWLDIDLMELPIVDKMNGVTFTQDSGDNKIGVNVTKNGESVTLTGTIKASIILPNGTTMEEDGELSGNQAWVILPDEAYENDGPISVFVKNVTSDGIATLCGVEGYVYKSR